MINFTQTPSMCPKTIEVVIVWITKRHMSIDTDTLPYTILHSRQIKSTRNVCLFICLCLCVCIAMLQNIKQFADWIQIIRALWSHHTVTMTGKHSARILLISRKISQNRHILSDNIFRFADILATVLLFHICYVDMTDYIIVDRYILTD